MAKTPRIDHDRLMKQLVSSLFESFVEAFLPEIRSHIDWACIKPVPTETFGLGKRYQPDLLYETRILGEAGSVLVHIEHQAQFQRRFAVRMLNYTALAHHQSDYRVLPIGIVTYRRHRDEPTVVDMTFPFMSVLHFEYKRVSLKKLEWRKFKDTDNPAVAALLSQMDYHPTEKVQVKIAFARAILRMRKRRDGSKLSDEVSDIVTRYFDTYCVVDSREEHEFLEALRESYPEEAVDYMEFLNRYERKGKEEGIIIGMSEGLAKGRLEGLEEGLEKGLEEGLERGLENGLVRGCREAIIDIVEIRFGEMPEVVRLRLEDINELESLKEIKAIVRQAGSREEATRAILPKTD